MQNAPITTEPKPEFNLIFMKQACKQVGKTLSLMCFDTYGFEITRITTKDEMLSGTFYLSPEEMDYTPMPIIDEGFAITLMNKPAMMCVYALEKEIVCEVYKLKDGKKEWIYCDSFSR